MQNYETLIKNLSRHEVEFIIVGGFAAVIHGVTLVTKDLDLCIPFSQKNCQSLLKALKELKPFHRMDFNKKTLEDSAENLCKYNNLYLGTNAGTLDLLGTIKGLGNYQELQPYTVETKLYGYSCKVADIEALIKSKKEMSSFKDQQTVIQLEAIKQKNGPSPK